MKYNDYECIQFIENQMGIKLYDFQKDIIRGWCEGKEVRTARCAGRSTLAKEFGKYVTYILKDNDYYAFPEVIIPYYRLVECGMFSEEHINNIKNNITKEQFEKEYCMKYED